MSDGVSSIANPERSLTPCSKTSQDLPLIMADDLNATDGMMATGAPVAVQGVLEPKPDDNPAKLGLHIHVDNDFPDFE
jgi:hypothetical protein